MRAYFGDARFDTLVHQRLLDQLYDQMWLYYNFFQPVLHLRDKQSSTVQGELHIHRKGDKAQTPLERLCASGVLVEAEQARLRTLRAQTNPRRLRLGIYQMRDQLFDLPLACRPQDSWLILDEETAEV